VNASNLDTVKVNYKTAGEKAQSAAGAAAPDPGAAAAPTKVKLAAGSNDNAIRGKLAGLANLDKVLFATLAVETEVDTAQVQAALKKSTIEEVWIELENLGLKTFAEVTGDSANIKDILLLSANSTSFVPA
jgi:hypothetical protein